MKNDNVEEATEWIFCKDVEGKCSGLNPKSKVLKKIPQTIRVHGQDVKGWLVKIVQEKSEGHVNFDLSRHSDE